MQTWISKLNQSYTKRINEIMDSKNIHFNTPQLQRASERVRATESLFVFEECSIIERVTFIDGNTNTEHSSLISNKEVDQSNLREIVKKLRNTINEVTNVYINEQRR